MRKSKQTYIDIDNIFKDSYQIDTAGGIYMNKGDTQLEALEKTVKQAILQSPYSKSTVPKTKT